MLSAPVDRNPEERLRSKMETARKTMLVIAVITAFNLILLLTRAGWYLLFSAAIPYYTTAIGIIMDLQLTVGGHMYTAAAVAVSIVALGAYLLCWWLSARRPQWLTVAMILFFIDCLWLVFVTAALFDNVPDSITDYLLHALALYLLYSGSRAARKLRRML